MRSVNLKRSICPITNLLDIVGDKWTLIVIRDLFLGKRRYAEFINSKEKIPTNILADRLTRIEEFDLVTKIPYQTNPLRFEYSLTEKGKALEPVLNEMAKWGLRHVKGTKLFPKVLPET
ncbi:winged helix-turn-helix transcriptional regulator [uncultured Bdellovibrio sp.]|uniref:winged helix-turn-helix transcriptional regulator n=1 Tax=Bdellovibrio sp. HCB-162 TaxID=3394234 RepID=UPI0025EAC83F|nr:helix-turn-helix domain-containing protein [uncultured Bdellovibrio sp.]